MITTSNVINKQELLDKQSSKAGSWRQQVEVYLDVICPLYKYRPTSIRLKIMCIEIMYSVKPLFVSSGILNAEALQKSEELELCKI